MTSKLGRNVCKEIRGKVWDEAWDEVRHVGIEVWNEGRKNEAWREVWQKIHKLTGRQA